LSASAPEPPHQAEPPSTELPLFPLKTVLFPGGPLSLRVFEPRYVDMVASCLRGANRFGVVAIRQGEEVGAATTYEVGTTAEIVDWHQESGGLLAILATGRERFRLRDVRRRPDGLYVGSVELLAAEAPQALPDAFMPLAVLLRRVLDDLPLYRGLPTGYEDAGWIAARLVEVLPLGLALKQSLLESPDALTRLERIASELKKAPAES
jgi:Lon protease-like protein